MIDDYAKLQAQMNIYNLVYFYFNREEIMKRTLEQMADVEMAQIKGLSFALDKIFGNDLDQVNCEGCGNSVYKDDCERTRIGGWLCEVCQDKEDGKDEPNNGGE